MSRPLVLRCLVALVLVASALYVNRHRLLPVRPVVAAVTEARRTLMTGDVRGADEALRPWLLSNPDDRGVVALAALCRLRLQRPDEAEQILRDGLRHCSNDSGLRLQLAQVLELVGRFDDAEAECRLLRADERYAVEATMLDARLRMRRGRPAEALALYDGLAGSRPPSAHLETARACSLEAMGRTTDAITALRHALELTPDHGGARLSLAKLLVATGRRAEADPLLNSLLRRWPNLPPARALLAAPATVQTSPN